MRNTFPRLSREVAAAKPPELSRVPGLPGSQRANARGLSFDHQPASNATPSRTWPPARSAPKPQHRPARTTRNRKNHLATGRPRATQLGHRVLFARTTVARPRRHTEREAPQERSGAPHGRRRREVGTPRTGRREPSNRASRYEHASRSTSNSVRPLGRRIGDQVVASAMIDGSRIGGFALARRQRLTGASDWESELVCAPLSLKLGSYCFFFCSVSLSSVQ